METTDLDITIRLPEYLRHQLASFQKAHQIEVASEAIQMILQEYFTGMGVWTSEGVVSLQSLWINQVVLQQGVILAQLQQYAYELKQSISHQQNVNRNKVPVRSSNIPVSVQSNEEFLSSIGLDLDAVEQGLTGVKLAERLGIDSSAISRKRNRPEFSQWTESHDPHRVGWEYRTSTRRFHPIQYSAL